MKIEIKEITNNDLKEQISREILSDLPEWFGLIQGRENYIKSSISMPFISAYVDDKPQGFIVLNSTSPDSCEIFVMGVKKKYQKKGIGKMLIKTYENLARSHGYTYSHVKTVQSGYYDEYDKTNKFYQAMNYSELECLPHIWDESNPCQIYVKYLGIS